MHIIYITSEMYIGVYSVTSYCCGEIREVKLVW
jgi:hypothetical protein